MRVGIIDSGLLRSQWPRLRTGQAFMWGQDAVVGQPLEDDHLGHGSVVTRIVLGQASEVELVMAQVFDQRAATTAAQVTAALWWLLDQQVNLINCSLGLHADRPGLREACSEAVARGVIICASSPVMGKPVYPAAYPGVVAVTGDARCHPHEWSWLQGDMAEFGAAVGRGSEGGASMACARFSGLLASFWGTQPAMPAYQVLDHFRQHATRTGPQRRESLCARSG